MLNGDKCHRKNSTEERRSSQMLGMGGVITILNRAAKINIIGKTSLSKDSKMWRRWVREWVMSPHGEIVFQAKWIVNIKAYVETWWVRCRRLCGCGKARRRGARHEVRGAMRSHFSQSCAVPCKNFGFYLKQWVLKQGVTSPDWYFNRLSLTDLLKTDCREQAWKHEYETTGYNSGKIRQSMLNWGGKCGSGQVLDIV